MKTTKKQWYQSKVLWVNIVAGVILMVQDEAMKQLIDPAMLAKIMVVANFVLRILTSKSITGGEE